MKTILVAIEQQGAQLRAYLHEPSPNWPTYQHRPCILICPGGGYNNISDRESDPVAIEFLAQGYQVFVLTYSVELNACNYQPLKELSRAVVTIRENATEWGVNPRQVAVLGFSAGGHLACSLGVFYNSPAVAADHGRNRPDGLGLFYPVISSGEYAHEGSFERLTGKKRCADWDEFSLEHFVTPDMPPCFLWHTVEDKTVPVQNTLLMVNALQKAGVSYECHLYPKGAHGLSICTKQVSRPNTPVDAHAATWVPLCTQWLDNLFGFER